MNLAEHALSTKNILYKQKYLHTSSIDFDCFTIQAPSQIFTTKKTFMGKDKGNKCVTSCETNLDTAYCAHIGLYLINFVKILLIVSSYIEPWTYYIFGIQNLLTFQVI